MAAVVMILRRLPEYRHPQHGLLLPMIIVRAISYRYLQHAKVLDLSKSIAVGKLPNRGGEMFRALRRCRRSYYQHNEKNQLYQHDQSSIDKLLVLITPQEEGTVVSSSSGRIASMSSSLPPFYYYYHALDLPNASGRVCLLGYVR